MDTHLLADDLLDDRDNGVTPLDRRRLARMLRDIRRNRYPIDVVHIEQSGECVLSVKCRPVASNGLHKIYSCTKTIVGILIGIAVDDGLLETHRPLFHYFPEFESSMKGDMRHIAVEHVLTMTWGLATQDGGDQWVGFDRAQDGNLLQRVFAAPMFDKPGCAFRYNNSGSHVLCCLLRKVTGKTPLEFAQRRLFGPLGITNIEWDTDGEAGNTGWSGIRMQATDLARIGTLFLNSGLWNGQRVLSERWISRSTKPHIAAAPNGHYGFHWWVGTQSFFASGIFGQHLIVAPERRLVAAMCSTLRSGDTNLPRQLFEKYVLFDPARPAQSTEDRTELPPAARGSRSYRNHTFVWRSEREGCVRNGRFVRAKAPAFSFQCPPRMRMAQLNDAHQVAALTTADEFPIHASFTSIPDGVALPQSGQQIINEFMRTQKLSHLEITGNREIALACGAAGYRTDFTYRWEHTVAMKGAIVSAYHGPFRVFLDVHTPLDLSDMAAIAESLNLIA